MKMRALDHIVLCVNDVAATRRFYERVLNVEAREERPGKWSLHFGTHKISLQDASLSPSIARRTVPGRGHPAPQAPGCRDCRRTGRAGRGDGEDPVGLLQ
jgi:catechol 2,3-dioxygenase-like lactoylglutathione lyase family enzyme